MRILLCIILLTLGACAGITFDNPKLTGYLTQEECRIGNGIKVGAELPPQCLKLPEFGFGQE